LRWIERDRLLNGADTVIAIEQSRGFAEIQADMTRELVADAQHHVLIGAIVERGFIVVIDIAAIIAADAGVPPVVSAADAAGDLDAGGRRSSQLAYGVHRDASEAGIVNRGNFEERPETDWRAGHSRRRIAAAENGWASVLRVSRQGQDTQREYCFNAQIAPSRAMPMRPKSKSDAIFEAVSSLQQH
jgi:hypothetical protein